MGRMGRVSDASPGATPDLVAGRLSELRTAAGHAACADAAVER
jgi:hypothetical protein